MCTSSLLAAATLGLHLQPPAACPPADIAPVTRRGALLAGLATVSVGLMPVNAVEPTKECLSGCFKECNAITKSGAYCSEQCDSYCSEEGATGTNDVLRSDVTAAAAPAAAKDCSTYKTDQAKAWCASQNKKTLAERSPVNDLSKNLGIFGDLGVTYSSGLEDLFATAFGAKRQNHPVNSADIGSFASEIGQAAKAAVEGGQ